MKLIPANLLNSWTVVLSKIRRYSNGWSLGLWLAFTPCMAMDLPDMGTSADTAMSLAEEQKLGEAFMRQLRREATVIDDLEINTYLSGLGNRLVSFSDTPAQSFRFFVIKDSSLNAFAVPGGFIGIHSGLILNTHNESELASVIAHEIAHVTQRHIARTVEAQNRMSLPVMAAMIAAVLIGVSQPEVGQAAASSIIAGNLQMQINFTRAHEAEADRVGMQILANADFNPLSMPAFFERLQASSRYYGESVPEFLRTHPVTINRIAEARDRTEKLIKKHYSESDLYHLMKAKLLVLTESNPHSLVKRLQETLKNKSYRDERATHYALALALLATRQNGAVQTHIDWLFKNDGDRVVYRLLQIHLALALNKSDEALQLYEQALQVYPADSLLSLEYAQNLIQFNQPKKAKTVLLKMTLSNYPEYFRLLAQSYGMTGSAAEESLALAEYYYLNGQTGLAIEQLKRARQFKNVDFYLASRIEARYHELQTELQAESPRK